MKGSRLGWKLGVLWGLIDAKNKRKNANTLVHNPIPPTQPTQQQEPPSGNTYEQDREEYDRLEQEYANIISVPHSLEEKNARSAEILRLETLILAKHNRVVGVNTSHLTQKMLSIKLQTELYEMARARRIEATLASHESPVVHVEPKPKMSVEEQLASAKEQLALIEENARRGFLYAGNGIYKQGFEDRRPIVPNNSTLVDKEWLYTFDDPKKAKLIDKGLRQLRSVPRYNNETYSILDVTTPDDYRAYVAKTYNDPHFTALYEAWIASGERPHLIPSLDHIQPLSRNGDHSIDNVQWMTLQDNQSKGAR